MHLFVFAAKNPVILRIFLRFLMDNGIYLSFINNTSKRWLNRDKPMYISEDIFSCSFIWHVTKEGHPFWYSIDTKWRLKWKKTFYLQNNL